MALFGLSKKKDNNDQTSNNMNPTQQNYTAGQEDFMNDQMPQNLQNQNYGQNNGYDEMDQQSPQNNSQQYPQYDVPAQDQGFNMQPNAPNYYQQDQSMPFNNMPPPPEPIMSQKTSQDQGLVREKIEEVTEAIIEEKWKDVLRDINKIIEWKEKSEARLARIEQDIVNIKENFDSLHKGVIGKIDEYDQNITNVGTEIKAMEKVFQKILPTFTENVNKLSMITKDISMKK